MRNAPAVEYPVGRFVWARRCQQALMALWLLAQTGWAFALGMPPWPGAWWFACLVGVCGLVWAHWRSRHPLVGRLAWQAMDGGLAHPDLPGEWRWFSAAYRHGTVLTQLDAVWDAQVFVLVRARTAAGLTLWLWLDGEAQHAQWSALRRALRAHGGPVPVRTRALGAAARRQG
ncbi:MAG TPA: hypothetical protein VFY31_06220 [Macromonas sp.]|nr:hypothetical protein [Macromonas sp.]